MSGDRFNEGKSPLSYILEAKHALEGCGNILKFGAVKYSRGNWRKGLNHTEICDSMIRHLSAYLSGEDNDKETGLPHVDHVLCNALFLSELTRTHPEMDDRGEVVPEGVVDPAHYDRSYKQDVVCATNSPSIDVRADELNLTAQVYRNE